MYLADTIEYMVLFYTTKSGSDRSPGHVFFNVLDMLTNAGIVYKEVTGENKRSRRNFILQLCDELHTPYTATRSCTRRNQIIKMKSEKIL